MKKLIEDEELDRQLRDAAPYIDDDGFTAQVLQSSSDRGRRPPECGCEAQF